MLLNGREVAAMLGVGASTVWRLTQGGQLPKPIYPTRRAPRWHRAEIEAAISKMSRDPAKAPLTQEWDGSRLRAASVDPMS
ncbi:helix-turn-helix domain-containing protein [Roseomonas sp. CAU 1739]|uniref:helix-turn-helix transcriptional regulator n=1 Tax=Roseomonas sp. CAU 1739 TaxID=3140364 RepID=UPI00325B2E34